MNEQIRQFRSQMKQQPRKLEEVVKLGQAKKKVDDISKQRAIESKNNNLNETSVGAETSGGIEVCDIHLKRGQVKVRGKWHSCLMRCGVGSPHNEEGEMVSQSITLCSFYGPKEVSCDLTGKAMAYNSRVLLLFLRRHIEFKQFITYKRQYKRLPCIL